MMPSRRGMRACERLECCQAVFRGRTSRRAGALRSIATRPIYLLTTIRWSPCRRDIPSGPAQVIQNKNRSADAEGLRRAAVHFGFGHGGQLLVGRLFLVEVLLEQGRTI